MIGTGSALTRNELLRRHLVAKLAEASAHLHMRSAADAAIGAALYPVLLTPRVDEGER